MLALTVLRATLPRTPALSALPPAEAAERTNALNRALHARLERANDALFLTQTSMNGTACVRFAVGAQRTERAHVEKAWEIIRACAAEVVSELVKEVEGA